LADQLKANTSVAGQVSYAFGSGETVDPGTDLTISGFTSLGAPATITAPTITPGETVGSAASGYVNALDSALTAAGIVGVTVTNTNGVLTIAGASATAGSMIANPVPSANASGTLQFNGSGNLTSPTADVNGITFSGLSGGAAPMTLDWDLYGAGSASNITQTAAASAQTAQTQNGSVVTSQNPTDFYSNFLSQLGSTVSEVQAENTAQNASVTQLQTQQNALSAVNLNDEATFMQQFERSYQAASEVFTILNTVMASALNLGVQTAVA
jgi:flagellar hook-associated protein 1 FlgK